MRKPKTKPARNIHGCGEGKEGLLYMLTKELEQIIKQVGILQRMKHIYNTLSPALSRVD